MTCVSLVTLTAKRHVPKMEQDGARCGSASSPLTRDSALGPASPDTALPLKLDVYARVHIHLGAIVDS